MISKSKINLVLVGGGQTHAPVLKQLGMHCPDNVDISLISANSIVPYSGMLPGYIAGTYSKEDCLIDLRQLSKFANATFINANVIGLDIKNQLVLLENRPPINYDILSLNVGIIPDLDDIEGKEYISPIKPAISFFYNWINIISKIKEGVYKNRFRVGVLGAGAGGIEIAFTIQKRLKQIIPEMDVHIFQRGDQILNGFSNYAQKKTSDLLTEKNIQIHLKEEICKITKNENSYDCKTNQSKIFQFDFLVGVVNAKPLNWIINSDLSKDQKGFILVNDSLQSISHSNVFAAGDIAAMQNYPRPKAGVFAVRQSIPLYRNLINLIEKKKLVNYKPQKKFLTLLNTGDGKAIAFRGNLTLGANKWIWLWKNQIDTKFMQKFKNLPLRMNPNMNPQTDDFQCKGCGGKVGADLLNSALDKIQKYSTNNREAKKKSKVKTIIGLKEREDSSLIEISGKTRLIQSVDFFNPIVNDLYISGKIAANHCLNDLYAKGIYAHSAHAIINLDQKIANNSEALFQILAGANSVFSAEGIELLGGHTNSGKETGIGFSCNGFLGNGNFYSKGNAKIGEVLILTKSIGTGLVFAAEMRNKISPLSIDAAIHSMLLSNFTALGILKKYKVGACTDITGFGLAGHLIEILKSSNLSARLELKEIPILFELENLLKSNPEIQSSLFPSNWQSFEKYIKGDKTSIKYKTLFDPQTSGGLLFSLTPKQAKNCLLELRNANYNASIIGTLLSQDKELIECS